MTPSSLDFLCKETIGIIGCGHLGRTIALELVSRGYSSDRLRLSLGRSRRSLQNIVDCGLHHCLARNDEICRDCSIIFITIPPQSLPKLQRLSFPQDKMVIFCMAKVPLQAIRRILGVEAVRMMPSGPSTIQEKRGITAIYPDNEAVISSLTSSGLSSAGHDGDHQTISKRLQAKHKIDCIRRSTF